MNLEDKELKELFKLADQIGKKRYHKLTRQDLEDYKQFDHWRYVNGDSECGTTQESQDWVKEHSDWHPICETRFSECGGRTIDHKLPRSQYPWLSMNLQNFWVICRACNQEKGEKHWFEYEHYMLTRYPDRLPAIQTVRPIHLLRSLKE
ncbi:HNH endonuclease [Oculatella sp. LEGE 06141]|uniref:HNH endonuclease n=1 Tax=Oculatella sp. LEGE 06141 TaxID=1828648 RepID=UPI001880F149|nr:HNH endonuclease [Oculatella sp. LEGE 06141]MBE9180691.1 HNH endonuclease [Oculatella sp. LEGE 06141]